ncbi:hypothetical protein [Leptospira fletcheri]|uniref:hypothetical protein n=1 Tax=Leptospira fletcheri TaxID=2484981 RepID=UPI00143827F5|nr:hypothetical protein [Leptospira fletcheri]
MEAKGYAWITNQLAFHHEVQNFLKKIPNIGLFHFSNIFSGLKTGMSSIPGIKDGILKIEKFLEILESSSEIPDKSAGFILNFLSFRKNGLKHPAIPLTINCKSEFLRTKSGK